MTTLSTSQESTPYRDPKRYSWLLSMLVPAALGIGPAVSLWLDKIWILWLPLITVYIVIPLLDTVVGEDTSNPPEQAVAQLERDPYYRTITYALVPILWGCVVLAAWFVATHALPWHGVLAVTLLTGVMGGFCINVGHELGHKRTRLEQSLAKLVLAPMAYGHFYVEHNRGHHRDVATPIDPASSRMGEGIYRFLLREMPGGLRRAWALEKQRLARLGKSPWHASNEVLQPLALTVVLWTALALWLGPSILGFLIGMSFWAGFQLTSANYIEHYGLLRQQTANGKVEICQPHHSWNSNHALSNWISFHLQRHSDHHAHASRRFQSLRHFPNLPSLPSGYFAMFTLAYFPPLWFAVMNRRLLAATGGDVRRINFQPGMRERLMERYHLVEPATA